MFSSVQNFLATNPQCAEYYDKKAQIQQERALENLTGWTFEETDLVLDIGSGNGYVTANIAKHVPYGKVIGLDIDPLMWSFSNVKYPPGEYPNLEFVQGNACELNYFEAFNKITSFATLSWIPVEQHQKIFDGIARALKPNGKALLRMSAEGKRPFNEVIENVCKDVKWDSYFTEYRSPAAYQSEEKLRTMSSQSNLKVIRIIDSTKTASYPTKEAFYDWLMTWEPHRNYIPEQLRKDFMYEVIDRYYEEMKFSNAITITLPGILIEAEKSIK